MPEVSIIMPYKNSEAFIGQAIDSIRKQSFTDWELILVNNNSTDKSAEIANNYSREDSRVCCLNQYQGEVAAAFNHGLKNSEGRIIVRMDSDDVSFSDRIEKQILLLKKSNRPTVVYSNVKPLGNSTFGWLRYLVWQNSFTHSDEIMNNRFIEMPVCNSTMACNREVFESTGYSETTYPEDYDFFLSLYEKGIQVTKSSDQLIFWRDHSNRLTRVHTGYSRENFFKVKAKYLFLYSKKVNLNHPKIDIWGTGKLARNYIDILERAGFTFNNFYDLKEGEFKRGMIKPYNMVQKSSFLISLVSNRGAGEKIDEFLSQRGFLKGKDYLIAG